MLISIICGGSGTRLWPSSRTSAPKQFIKFDNKLSLFQRSINCYRSLLENKGNQLLIIANIKHKFIINEQLKEINYNDSYNLINEPCSRNTMPVAILACLFAKEHNQKNVLLAPSDHLIENDDIFIDKINSCDKFLQNNSKIITFGLTPTSPHTGYGYINYEGQIDGDFYKVNKFVEKPNLETANKYIKNGNYLWNSGIFAINCDVLLCDAEKFDKKLYQQTLQSYKNANIYDNCCDIKIEDFSLISEQSIDYGVIEKSDNVVTCLCRDLKWSDLGDWGSVSSSFGNYFDKNNITELNSKDCNIINRSSNIHIATCGVENLTIVAENDAIMVVDNNNLQGIKELHKQIKSKKSALTEQHTFDYRPWGEYYVIADTDDYKIKKIIVKPQMKLSLQLHHKRSEHWICISGNGEATVGEKNLPLTPGCSVYISQGEKHRLINTSKDVDLVIVEVQCGTYFGEDDIVRLQDDWKRS